MEHTRRQRLDNECSHREYFAQFVTEMTKETVLHHIGLSTILASTDNAMNDIELITWDWLPQLPRTTYDHMKQLGDSMTMAGKVCIYKEAAKQLKEEAQRIDQMITMDEFLKAYCSENEISVDGCTRNQGFTVSHLDDMQIPKGFREVKEWKDHHFRSVWINNDKLSTITYCEGDVIVMQHATQESYNEEIINATIFYKTH